MMKGIEKNNVTITEYMIDHNDRTTQFLSINGIKDLIFDIILDNRLGFTEDEFDYTTFENLNIKITSMSYDADPEIQCLSIWAKASFDMQVFIDENEWRNYSVWINLKVFPEYCSVELNYNYDLIDHLDKDENDED